MVNAKVQLPNCADVGGFCAPHGRSILDCAYAAGAASRDVEVVVLRGAIEEEFRWRYKVGGGNPDEWQRIVCTRALKDALATPDAAAAAVQRALEALEDLATRAERARLLLSKDGGSWGMLDTAQAREAIAALNAGGG